MRIVFDKIIVPNPVSIKPVQASRLDELINRHVLSNQAAGRSPQTIAWYRDMLTPFSRYLKANRLPTDMSAINVETIKTYILYLRGKPKFKGHPFTPSQAILLSPTTVQCHVRALKAFSSWLFAERLTTENRLGNLKLPKAPINVVEPLTPEEIEKVIAAVDKSCPAGIRNHALVVNLLDTGLRASEAAGISLANHNLADGYVKVMGKGAKERIVPIGRCTRMVLSSYIEKARPKPVVATCTNLFLSTGGKPITANTIKILFCRLAKSSGVSKLHAHLCRHTFAVNYLLNGGDIFTLREILEHTTLEMVNRYLHFASSQIIA